jgi:hypothetical protein
MSCDESSTNENTVMFLHATEEVFCGRSVKVEVRKTSDEQIDLMCGCGVKAIVCVAINASEELEVDLTDEREDHRNAVRYVYRGGVWERVT